MSGDKSRYRPPAGLILGSPVHLLAFGGGAGLAPLAPGTFGTLVGLPLWWLLAPLALWPYAVLVLLLFVVGCWVCGRSAALLGVHDHPGIVFDEIVGYLIAAAPLLPAWGVSQLPIGWGMLAAFVAFRVFDILKPPPIRWVDRQVRGGFGIMLDDVLAAVPAAAVVWLLRTLM